MRHEIEPPYLVPVKWEVPALVISADYSIADASKQYLTGLNEELRSYDSDCNQESF